MGGYGWIGGLIQRGQQWADRGVGWALYRKQRNDYAQQVRHLRRREYQDMMFSMKAAGLNPILASGAQPGHSAAFSGAPQMNTQLIDTNASMEAPFKREALKAKGMESFARGRLSDQQSGLALDQRDLTKATTAFQIMSIDKLKDERALLQAQRLRELSQVGALDASAKESLARTRNQELDSAEKEATSDLYQTPAGTAIKVLEKVGGAVLPWGKR